MTETKSRFVNYVINWTNSYNVKLEEKQSIAESLEKVINLINRLMKKWKVTIESYDFENDDIHKKLSTLLSKVSYKKENMNQEQKDEAFEQVDVMESNIVKSNKLRVFYTRCDLYKNLFKARLLSTRNRQRSSIVSQLVSTKTPEIDYNRWNHDVSFVVDEIHVMTNKDTEINEEIIKHQQSNEELLDQFIKSNPSIVMEIMSPAPPKSPLSTTLAKFQLNDTSDNDHEHDDEDDEKYQKSEYEQGKQMFNNAKQTLIQSVKPIEQKMDQSVDNLKNKFNSIADM